VNPRLFGLHWAPLLVLGLSGALAGCGPKVPDVIKIGVAQPLSGPSEARGKDLLNGVNLAVEELNASNFKIDGKVVKFETVAHDDKADKETAKKVAQDLVNEKVVAVIGNLSSDITEATIPIYKQADIPQFFTSSASELTKLGGGNTFRLVANDTLQASAVASYVIESVRAANVALIYEDTAFGRPMGKDIVEKLTQQQKKVPINDAVNNKTTDFNGFVAKLKATPVDVLVAVLRDNQVIPLLQQMKAAGLGAMVVVSTNSSKTDKLAKAPEDVARLYVTSSAVEAREFVGGAAFLKKFSAAYKSEPVWGAHYAYDAVYVLAEAVARAKSVEPAVLREKLRTLEMMGPVTSTMRFDSTGEQRYGAISVYQRRNARWEPLMRSDKW
jgi:branched-chain amino acid transport system substrate-binding protein